MDLSGLEKYIIITGKEKTEWEFWYTAEYYKKLALKAWFSEKNIITRNNIQGTKAFNDIISPYGTNIANIVYIVHGDNSTIGIWKTTINMDNVGGINPIYSAPVCSKAELTLVSCNTGKGDNSIAQNMSNQLGISVEAPSGFVDGSDRSIATLDGWFLDSGEPTLFNNWNVFSNPLDWLSYWWVKFNPNK